MELEKNRWPGKLSGMNASNLSELLRLPMPIRAALFQERQFVATGEASLRGPDDENSFLSTSGDISHTFPRTGGAMRLEGTSVPLRLIDFLPCLGAFEMNKRRHFHFRFKCHFP
jgi:hypothetical protein